MKEAKRANPVGFSMLLLLVPLPVCILQERKKAGVWMTRLGIASLPALDAAVEVLKPLMVSCLEAKLVSLICDVKVSDKAKGAKIQQTFCNMSAYSKSLGDYPLAEHVHPTIYGKASEYVLGHP